MTTLKDIISNYKEKLTSLNTSSETTFEIVINSDWDKIDEDLKIIYCGDNPGKTEKENNKYFVGQAGSELNSFVSTHNKRLGINSSQFSFFNKTPYYSDKTSEITQNKDPKLVIQSSIKITIDCLFEIWQAKKIPIVIFGIDEGTYIVKTFKDTIVSDKKYSDFLTNLIILNHPSHNSLFATFGKLLINKFNNQDEINDFKYTDLIDEAKKNWL